MSRNNSKGPGPVPERWTHCPRKSTRLIAKNFLAFKTPLSERFNNQLEIAHKFTPKMLLDSTKSYGIRIGLWIDLTNTSRFYDTNEVKKGYEDGTQVMYVKMKLRGHGETPDKESVDFFNNLCMNFNQQKPDEAIGVHCTHGFNRTGFLIVSYLVEVCNWGLTAAMLEFSSTRPPGIYKGDYINELYRRFEPDTDPPNPPIRPSWCIECDDSQPEPESTGGSRKYSDRETGGGDRRDGRRKGNKRHHTSNKEAEFMEGVQGIFPVLDQNQAEYIQRVTQSMCHWETGGFPGAQPVSMDKDNIALLKQKPYNVSWKADGTRYMMVILKENEVYMLNRDNSVFHVPGLRFVNRKSLREHLTNTLLDGEMVIDRFNGENIPRYLVYDVICVNGIDISKFPFYPARLTCIDVDIIKPRHIAMEKNIINKTDEPFSVRAKIFCSVDKAASFLGEKFSRQLSHEPDGLIFQPSKEYYTPGPCPDVLKWKPPSLNSIDFRLKITTETGEGLLAKKIGELYVGSYSRPFSTMKFTRSLEPYNNKIIECRLDNGKWVFMRERTDKSFPNSYNTALSVMNSIRHPVTKDYLLNVIRDLTSDRDMMPPPPPRR